MGAFIAKQPNGLYCRYGEIVDNITHYNMTEEDYIAFPDPELCQNGAPTTKEQSTAAETEGEVA